MCSALFPVNSTLLARVPPDLFLVCIPFMLHTRFLIKKTRTLERFAFVRRKKKRTQRNSVPVSLSYGRDTRVTAPVLFYTHRDSGRRRRKNPAPESPPIITCLSSPRPADRCATASVCHSRRRSSPAHCFIRLHKRKKGPISLRDLTNAISPGFVSVLPPNGFLRYCITRFI